MLLFCDGFDAYAQMADTQKKGWTPPGTYGEFSTTNGRYGGGSIGFVSNYYNYAWKRAGTFTYVAGGTLNVAFWMRQSGPPDNTYGGSQTWGIFGLDAWVVATVDQNGKFSFYPYGSSTVNATRGTHNVCDGQYHWVEIQIVFATGTTGSVSIYVDEQQDLLVQNLQTVYSGVPSGAIYLGSGSNYGNNRVSNDYDDLIVWDNTGAAFNGFPLGKRRISTLYPNAPGDSAQLTPSAGQNYACVDGGFAGTGQSLSDAGSGHLDLYQQSHLQYSPNVINAVVGNYGASNGGSQSASLIPQIKSGGTVASGATDAVAAGAASFFAQYAWTADPSGAAWTPANVNAAQIGVGD